MGLGDEEQAQISQPSLAAYRVPSFGYAFFPEIPIPELEDPRRRASLSKSSVSSQYHHRERSLNEQSRRRPSSPPPSFVSSPEYSHSRTASWIGDNKFHFGEDVKPDGNTIPDRQRYMLRLARSLISYGAPAHRLEEYMQESAEVLRIGGQFLYIPGCMICSFNDTPNAKEDQTAEVKIVRQSEGENYEKVDSVRTVYKEVKRGYISAEAGSRKLDAIMERPNQNNYAVRIFSYGLAAASIGPLAYESRLIDLPVQFVLGLITRVLEIIVNQWMPFSVLFEVVSPMITTFLARALGSINGGNTFCFSLLAQTALVIILPGVSITNAMLEMQSKSIVSGSIRTIKVMLFILFISLGMSIGSTAYGVLDPNAVTSAKCQDFDLQSKYYQFIAATTGGLAFVLEKQIKWSQAPAATLIALLGFSASFLSSVWLPKLPQFGNIIASATIGVLGNLYSRLGYGAAAGVVIPGLTVLVPGSFSAASALLVGINNADMSQNITRLSDLGNRFGNKLTLDDNLRNDMSRVIVTAGISMIQLGVALAVGLFISNLLIYPVARKRKGLFGY